MSSKIITEPEMADISHTIIGFIVVNSNRLLLILLLYQ